MGAMFGMQLAVSYPERVIGLFLISPLSTPEVRSSLVVCYARTNKRTRLLMRQQVGSRSRMHGSTLTTNSRVASWSTQRRWKTACSAHCSLVSTQAMRHLFERALLFFVRPHHLAASYRNITITLVQCRGRQAVQPLDTIQGTCTIFLNRTGYEDSELQHLAQSRIPVALVHGTADVAYPPEYYAKFADQLKRCGANVRMHEIDGAPHFANTTHYAAYVSLLNVRDELQVADW